jgi:hypothetical protein
VRVRSYTYEAGLNALYYNTKASANKRGYVFELSVDEVSLLCQQLCSYCGKEPSQVLSSFPNFKYNGIDRVDNSLGYVEGNCVPCCKLCNRMKYVLSVDAFKEHIETIIVFQRSKSFA